MNNFYVFFQTYFENRQVVYFNFLKNISGMSVKTEGEVK